MDIWSNVHNDILEWPPNKIFPIPKATIIDIYTYIYIFLWSLLLLTIEITSKCSKLCSETTRPRSWLSSSFVKFNILKYIFFFNILIFSSLILWRHFEFRHFEFNILSLTVNWQQHADGKNEDLSKQCIVGDFKSSGNERFGRLELYFLWRNCKT